MGHASAGSILCTVESMLCTQSRVAGDMLAVRKVFAMFWSYVEPPAHSSLFHLFQGQHTERVGSGQPWLRAALYQRQYCRSWHTC